MTDRPAAMNESAPSASPDWRPRFHFTAPRGWINDPNGLFHVGGTWHLQYQYEWPRQWGHAASRDLMHWDQWPVALQPDEHGDCWSGCTVEDPANTSEFFGGSRAGLVTVYTSQDSEHGQRISLAWSGDGGRTWDKFKGNPVLRRARRACRDPKVFWHEPTRRWVMILTEDSPLTLFTSANLRDWTEVSRFAPRGGPGIDGFECPDLFELPIENHPGKSKWILSASYLSGDNFKEGGGFGTCAQRYHVGEFDGVSFVADPGEEGGRRFGAGPDEYAAIVWPREKSGARRTLAIAWMNHWGYAKQIPTGEWQGNLTLPRELTLHETAPGKFVLRHAPVRELWTRLKRGAAEEGWTLMTESVPRVVAQSRSGALNLKAKLSAAAELRVALFADARHETVIGFDRARRVVYFDRTRSGSPEFDPNFSRHEETPWPGEGGGELEATIVWDVSTIEVFVDGGAIYLSGLAFPPEGAQEVRIGAVNDEVEMGAVEVWSA